MEPFSNPAMKEVLILIAPAGVLTRAASMVSVSFMAGEKQSAKRSEAKRLHISLVLTLIAPLYVIVFGVCVDFVLLL